MSLLVRSYKESSDVIKMWLAILRPKGIFILEQNLTCINMKKDAFKNIL